MMWEWLGWLVAGCLALIVVAFTVAMLIVLVKAAVQPLRPRRKTGTVEVFRGSDRG